jgi:hypothetical protein
VPAVGQVDQQTEGGEVLEVGLRVELGVDVRGELARLEALRGAGAHPPVPPAVAAVPAVSHRAVEAEAADVNAAEHPGHAN